MGIEDKLKALNASNAQELVRAAQDKKINDEEAKKLGLTENEQEELTSALTSGKAEVKEGRVVFNEGFQEKEPEAVEEKGFFGKLWDGIKDVAAVGAATIVSPVLGTAVAASKSKDDESFIGKAWNKTKQFIADMPTGVKAVVSTVAGAGAALVAGNLTGGLAAGLALSSPVGWIGLAVGVGTMLALSSCSKGDYYEADNEYTVYNQNTVVNDFSATLKAYLEARDAKNDAQMKEYWEKLLGYVEEISNDTGNINGNVAKILENSETNKEQLKTIVQLFRENNQILQTIKEQTINQSALLQEIADNTFQSNVNEADAITILLDIKASCQHLEQMIEKLPDNIRTAIKGDLVAILNAVRYNGKKLSDLQGELKSLAGKLTTIIGQININNTQNAALIKLFKENNWLLRGNNDLLYKINNNIKISTQEMKNALKEILGAINTADKNNYQGLQAILDILEIIGEDVSAIKKDVSEIKNDMKNLLGLTEDELNMLDEINGNVQYGNEILQQMNELLRHIDEDLHGLSDDMKKYFKDLIKQVAKNGGKLDDIMKLLAMINKNVIAADQHNQRFMTAIMQMIGRLGFIISAGMNKILEAVEKGNAKLEDIAQLIESLNSLVEKYGDKMGEYTQQILDAIGEGNTSLSAIITLLTNIDKHVVDGNQQNNSNAEKIMKLLSRIGFNMASGLNKIYKAIEKGNGKLDDIVKLIDKLNGLVEKYGDKMGEYTQQILDAIGDGNTSLTTIIGLLEQLDKHVVEGNEQNHADNMSIMKLLSKLGFRITAGMNNILTAINKNTQEGRGMERLLWLILQKMEQIDSRNQGRFEAIIEAMSKISTGNVDLSTIESLLKEIRDLSKENGIKLDDIVKQNQTIITILNSFKRDVARKLGNIEQALNAIKTGVGEIKGDVNEVKNFLSLVGPKLQEILDKIGNGGTCELDFDALMARLQEILDAIADHEVNVTVDVTGKVTCECNCNCGGGQNHEGILDDLEYLNGSISG